MATFFAEGRYVLDNLVTHCMRVANYAMIIDSSNNHLYIACLLHDIGKTAIPPSIINKEGPLTNYEYSKIKGHPLQGATLLRKLLYPEDIVLNVLYHHERWDGNGYPYGLQRLEIPLHSRMLAIADTYDAMTSNRPYRKALPPDTALEEIATKAGSQFDPYIVELFLDKIEGENSKIQFATPLFK